MMMGSIAGSSHTYMHDAWWDPRQDPMHGIVDQILIISKKAAGPILKNKERTHAAWDRRHDHEDTTMPWNVPSDSTGSDIYVGGVPCTSYDFTYWDSHE